MKPRGRRIQQPGRVFGEPPWALWRSEGFCVCLTARTEHTVTRGHLLEEHCESRSDQLVLIVFNNSSTTTSTNTNISTNTNAVFFYGSLHICRVDIIVTVRRWCCFPHFIATEIEGYT